MTTIDARGFLCPKPLVLTRKAYNDLDVSDVFKLLIDNETSFENVSHFLSDNNIPFDFSLSDGVWTLTISKTQKLIVKNETDYCPLPKVSVSTTSKVVCFNKDLMGFGPQELGGMLLKSFLTTLVEVPPLPKSFVFYNSGVLLTKSDSSVIKELKELENLGIKMLVCGACLDFYKIKEKKAVGRVSNMFDILSELNSPSMIIYP